jgi:hypothetical protein
MQEYTDKDTDVVNFLLSGNGKIQNYFLVEDDYGGYFVCYKLDDGREIGLSIDLESFNKKVVDFLIKINSPIQKS